MMNESVVSLLQGIPGTVTRPLGQTDAEVNLAEHMFTAIDITPKGIEILANYVAQVRENIGMEVPLAAAGSPLSLPSTMHSP